MSAVAEGFFLRVLTLTQNYSFFLRKHQHFRTETTPRVGSVAERLGFRLTTAAPIVSACFQFKDDRFFGENNRFFHIQIRFSGTAVVRLILDLNHSENLVIPTFVKFLPARRQETIPNDEAGWKDNLRHPEQSQY